jgi:hypothetical protein
LAGRGFCHIFSQSFLSLSLFLEKTEQGKERIEGFHPPSIPFPFISSTFPVHKGKLRKVKEIRESKVQVKAQNGQFLQDQHLVQGQI